MEKNRSYRKKMAISVLQEKLVAAEGRKAGTFQPCERWFEQKEVKHKKASVPNSTGQKSRFLYFLPLYLMSL